MVTDLRWLFTGDFFNRRGAENAELFFLNFLCGSAVKIKKKGCTSVPGKRKGAHRSAPLQSYNSTILFNNFHLRHLITLTNLVNHF